MFQDKLAQIKKQLQQLEEGTLPEYLRRLKRLEQQHKERLRLNDVWKTCCVGVQCDCREYIELMNGSLLLFNTKF